MATKPSYTTSWDTIRRIERLVRPGRMQALAGDRVSYVCTCVQR
jgi:hypothetical protein